MVAPDPQVDGAEPAQPVGDPRPGSGRTRRRQLRFIVIGCVVAVVLAVVLFGGIGTGGGGSGTADVAPGINSYAAALLDLNVLAPADSHRTPNFELTDQHGVRVSLAGFRGKVVVLSFNDDRCTDVCTLLAQDILVADRDLGSMARDVVFLSVNINPFYPQVKWVKLWADQHGLGRVRNWVSTTGSVPHLEAVWKDYGAYVQLDYANRTVVHSTELYFIDPGGKERAIGGFGVNAANTTLYAHTLAQMAADLLPAAERGPVAGPITEPPSRSDVTILGQAPTFVLPSLGDPRAKVSLASSRGRYTVLNFWSSTCTLCRQEMPHVEEAYRDLGSKVAFLGIDVADNAGAARSFAKATGVTYPIGFDASGQVAGTYQISGLPFTVIVGPRGKLLMRHPGALTTEQLKYILGSIVPSLGGGGSFQP